MRKLLPPCAVILFLAAAAPAFAEWELGVSFAPVMKEGVNHESSNLDFLAGFHLGYCWWYIGYVSWDAIALPDSVIFAQTSDRDSDGVWQPGYYAPGFLNLYDVGIRFRINPVIGFVELGANNFLVSGKGLETLGTFGVNFRAGAAIRWNWWSIGLSVTEVFHTLYEMSSSFSGIFSEGSRRNQARTQFSDGFLWTIMATVYLGKE